MALTDRSPKSLANKENELSVKDLNKLEYAASPDYAAWWSANNIHAKLHGHSIYTKGAVIWNAAIAERATAAPAQSVNTPEFRDRKSVV